MRRFLELHVLRRKLPDARVGKSAGLDDAWRFIHADVLVGECAGWSTEHRLIVGVVDADGRIPPDAPHALRRGRFSLWTRGVGGVQALVRIYNRRHYLTWRRRTSSSASMAHVYQTWGARRGATANMGGNGQVVAQPRSTTIVTGEGLPPGVVRGPWRDRLTEDQDIGVRMILACWVAGPSDGPDGRGPAGRDEHAAAVEAAHALGAGQLAGLLAPARCAAGSDVSLDWAKVDQSSRLSRDARPGSC